MDTFFENAQRIFDVARAGPCSDNGAENAAENQDFALLIRPDGALHFVMESPWLSEATREHDRAACSYRITRSRDGVRVEGHSGERDCILFERKTPATRGAGGAGLLRDQVLYRIASPLLIS